MVTPARAVIASPGCAVGHSTRRARRGALGRESRVAANARVPAALSRWGQHRADDGARDVRGRGEPLGLELERDEGERAFADQYAQESFGAYVARSVGSWVRQQPANLRAVTPLLRWPNERIRSWSTWRGLTSNAIIVLLGMAALTVFLGFADGVLLALRRLVTARATGAA
jgi:hypothetical protein